MDKKARSHTRTQNIVGTTTHDQEGFNQYMDKKTDGKAGHNGHLEDTLRTPPQLKKPPILGFRRGFVPGKSTPSIDQSSYENNDYDYTGDKAVIGLR